PGHCRGSSRPRKQRPEASACHRSRSSEHLETIHLVQAYLHQVTGGGVHRVQHLASEGGTQAPWNHHELRTTSHECDAPAFEDRSFELIVLLVRELRHACSR